MREILTAAIQCGDQELVISLMQATNTYFLMNYEELNDETIAHSLAKVGLIKALEWLHEHLPASLKKEDKQGITPFIAAALSNNTGTVKFFRNNHIDDFSTLAHRAAFLGRDEEIRLISNSEALLVDGAGFEPIIYAVAAGNIRSVKKLAKMMGEEQCRNELLLRLAIENHHQELLDFILNKTKPDVFLTVIKESNVIIKKNRKNHSISLMEYIEDNYQNPGKWLVEKINQHAENEKHAREAREMLLYACVFMGCEKTASELLEQLYLDNDEARSQTLKNIMDVASQATEAFKKKPRTALKKDLVLMTAQLCAEDYDRHPRWMLHLLMQYIHEDRSYSIGSLLSKVNRKTRLEVLNSNERFTLDQDFSCLLNASLLSKNRDITSTLLVYGASLEFKSQSGLTTKEVVEKRLPEFKSEFQYIFDGQFNTGMRALYINYINIINCIEAENVATPNNIGQLKTLATAMLAQSILLTEVDIGTHVYSSLFTLFDKMNKSEASYKSLKMIAELVEELSAAYHFSSAFNGNLLLAKIFHVLKMNWKAYEQNDFILSVLKKDQKNSGDVAQCESQIMRVMISKISLFLLHSFEIKILPSLEKTVKSIFSIFTEERIIGVHGFIISPLASISLSKLSAIEQLFDEQKLAEIKFINNPKKTQLEPETIFEITDALLVLANWIEVLGSENEKLYFDKNKTGDKEDSLMRNLIGFKLKLMLPIKKMHEQLVSNNENTNKDFFISNAIDDLMTKIEYKCNLIQDKVCASLIKEEELSIKKEENRKLNANKKKNKKRNASATNEENKQPETQSALPGSRGVNHLELKIKLNEQVVPSQDVDNSEWKTSPTKKTNASKSKNKSRKARKRKVMKQPSDSRTNLPILTSSLVKDKEATSSQTLIAAEPKTFTAYVSFRDTTTLVSPSEIKPYIPHDIICLFDRFKKDELWLVGGAVRDALQAKSPKDFDFVTGLSLAEVLNKFPEAELLGDGEKKTIRVNISGFDVDIVTLAYFDINAIESSLEKDSLSRDFTCNALYWRPGHHQEDAIEFLKDFHHGQKHLQRDKRLEKIPSNSDNEHVFVRFPKRLLRGIIQAIKENLEFSEELMKYKQKNIRAQVSDALIRLDTRILRSFYEELKKQTLTDPDEILRKYDLSEDFAKRGITDTKKSKLSNHPSGMFGAKDNAKSDSSSPDIICHPSV